MFFTSSMNMKSYLPLSLNKNFFPTVYFEMFYGVATSTPVVHFFKSGK